MITGKTLKRRGWPEGRIIGVAKQTAAELLAAGLDEETALSRLDEVRQSPDEFLSDAQFSTLAQTCLSLIKKTREIADDLLLEAHLPYQTWGAEDIDAGAVKQMDDALRLPVAAAGALMPDAHIGYGLPIGGVLATCGAVIPYAVGVDIACRMRLSIYEASPHVLGQEPGRFARAITDNTKFGAGEKWTGRDAAEHDVLDDPGWKATGLLRGLHDKGRAQLGTSGSGNHFVEWGAFTLEHDDHELGLKAGRYVALLSHSGSRGVGFKIANYYSKLARDLHPRLDRSVLNLAWLPLDSEAGQEYWISMQLAGRFASANHAIIHQRVARAARLREVAAVENHHNFAWKETLADGREAIVHRKGATPAGLGVAGIIPGSMADPGYVVRGKGLAASLNSASHGAGRRMGRRQAINSITKTQRDQYLRERGVTLLGGGLDESPQAYKDIETVIAAQRDLIEIVGQFQPVIVQMASEPGDV